MLGDLGVYVFFGWFVYLMFKVVTQGFGNGLLSALKLALKGVYFCTIGPVVFVVRMVTGDFGRVFRDDEPVGVARETITITDSFKDRKGRTVRVNKTININAKSVSKRDLNRIR